MDRCIKKDKVVRLQQAIIPDYRMGLFLLLRQKWGTRFQVFAGGADFGGSPVSTPRAWNHFERVQNIYLLGDCFLWQVGCVRKLIDADVAILNGNMRILSNLWIQLRRKWLGRRTILWGHAEGRSGLATSLRGVYLFFCDGFIAYTESQAKMLRARHPSLKVWVAANSCVSAADCMPVEAAHDEVDSILYVGRLVEKKKVRLLLEGYIRAQQDSLLAEHIRLVFVGAGAERQHLETLAEEAGVADKVNFAGHVSGIAELRAYYQRAICSVSPGYVGLSATQSFSFGVPMLVARDEFHSPEIETCKEGFNAEFFESNDPQSLAEHLQRMAATTEASLSRRKKVSAWTASHYSFEAMQDGVVNAVEGG
ncbi:MAG: Glycosyltransferase Gtf1 [Opitutia bacterium UBA7350]|nr:MAG: Glycosyltransferase Gtf1 [Opitutae bacterium UBA7350]